MNCWGGAARGTGMLSSSGLWNPYACGAIPIELLFKLILLLLTMCPPVIMCDWSGGALYYSTAAFEL